MANRNCPIEANGHVDQTATCRGDSIRRYPSIRRALPITAGRHTGAHEVAMSGTEVVIRVIERILWALGMLPAGYRARRAT